MKRCAVVCEGSSFFGNQGRFLEANELDYREL
jgi:hypothetical protein